MKATPALHAANPGKHGTTYVGTPYGASAIIRDPRLSTSKYLDEQPNLPIVSCPLRNRFRLRHFADGASPSLVLRSRPSIRASALPRRT